MPRMRAPLETGPGRWDDEAVNPFLDFVSHNWWLVFPLSGLAGGWARSWSRASERRHRRRVELYQLQNRAAQAEQATQTEVLRLEEAHDAVNRRWLEYELDVGKLIDFPVMSDVREPLTVAFLRAKREADGLRPDAPGDITTAARLSEYRAAVRSFERQTAYKRARRELDGLIILPEAAIAALEEKVAGMIDAPKTPDFHQG